MSSSNISLVKAIRRPFRPLKRFYFGQRDRIHFKKLVHPTDVFLVGHPKSGNTMMAYILAITVFKDFAKKINLANIDHYTPGVHFEDLSIGKHPNLSEPRVFRNEVPIYPQYYPKTLYLVRDPRATLVSYYHMYSTIFNDTSTTLADFVDEYLRNGNIQRYEPQIDRWDRQVLRWVHRAARDDRVMIVKFEDMVKNKPETLKKVLAFTGIACSDELFKLVLERSSFEAMRKTEEEFGEENYPGDMGKRGRFMRQGKTAGWKEELPPDTVREIEREFAAAMKVVGYV
jgi:hypothetical protein